MPNIKITKNEEISALRTISDYLNNIEIKDGKVINIPFSEEMLSNILFDLNCQKE